MNFYLKFFLNNNELSILIKFTFKFRRKYASQLIVNLELKDFKIDKQIKGQV